MNRSLVRSAACTIAAAAFTLIVLAVPASSPSQAASINITVNGAACSSFSWNSTTNTLDCSTSTGSTPPTGCSFAGAPGTAQAAPYSYNLTASCTSNDVTSWQWSGGSTATTAQIVGSISATTVFNVKATNSSGGTWNGGVTISIGGAPPPPPPGGGSPDTSACTALGLNPKVVVAAWASNTTLYTGNAGNFGPNDALIVQFTTGSIASPLSGTKGGGSVSIGHISSAEYQGPTTPRAGSLSASPCDFTVGLPMGDGCGTTMFSGDTAPSKGFTVTTPPSSGACAAILQPNTTYYWNLTNFVPAPPTGTQQCGQSTCNMIITLTKPSGT